MKYLHSIVLTSSLAMVGSAAFAQQQDTLQQSMIVERDFSPIVRDANKIDQQPKQEEIKIRKSATRYADWLAPTASSSLVGRMPAGQVVATDNLPKNGYVELSAGNYTNADLKAGVSYKDFSAEVNGFATKGDLDLPYAPMPGKQDLNSTWESRMLIGGIKLGYGHTFLNSSRVRAYIGASGRSYNMMNAAYGFTSDRIDDSELCYYLTDDIKKQKTGRISVGASYDIRALSLELEYNHDEESLFGTSENSVKIEGKYGWYGNRNWQVVAGLNLGVQFAERTNLTILPEIEYSRFVDSKLSRIYANLKVGISRYELYDLLGAMPMAYMTNYDSEKNLLDFTFGYEDNNNGAFHWGIFAGAAVTLDRLDAVMTTQNLYPGNDPNAPQTLAQLTSSDEFEVKAGAYMDYECSKYFKTKAGLSYNSNPRLGDAATKIDIHFMSNPIADLKLDLGFNGGFNREMPFVGVVGTSANNPFGQKIDLDNILDLNFRIDYKLWDNLNAFIFGNNLMNQDYQLWAGVPAQKINIHAGFDWRF